MALEYNTIFKRKAGTFPTFLLLIIYCYRDGRSGTSVGFQEIDRIHEFLSVSLHSRLFQGMQVGSEMAFTFSSFFSYKKSRKCLLQTKVLTIFMTLHWGFLQWGLTGGTNFLILCGEMQLSEWLLLSTIHLEGQTLRVMPCFPVRPSSLVALFQKFLSVHVWNLS